MSTMNPNDPFGDSGSAPDSASGVAAKKSSKGCVWAIGGCGTVAVLSLFVCCGGGYFLLNFLTNSYQQQLANNPVINEHLGELESLQMNLTKTAEAAENSDGETFAFDASGSVASGTILIRQDPSGDGTGIASAELILEDGSRHNIPLGNAAPEIDTNFEIDLGESEPAPSETAPSESAPSESAPSESAPESSDDQVPLP